MADILRKIDNVATTASLAALGVVEAMHLPQILTAMEAQKDGLGALGALATEFGKVAGDSLVNGVGDIFNNQVSLDVVAATATSFLALKALKSGKDFLGRFRRSPSKQTSRDDGGEQAAADAGIKTEAQKRVDHAGQNEVVRKAREKGMTRSEALLYARTGKVPDRLNQ